MRCFSSTTATSSVECSTSDRKRRSLRSSETRARFEKKDQSMSTASSALTASVNVRRWCERSEALWASSSRRFESASAAPWRAFRPSTPRAKRVLSAREATDGSEPAACTSGPSAESMRVRLPAACTLICLLVPWLARTAVSRAALSRTEARKAWARVAVADAPLARSASERTVSAANSTTDTTSAGTSHWNQPDSPPGATRAADAARILEGRGPRRIPRLSAVCSACLRPAPPLRVYQDARIHDPGGIERAFRAPQRGREGLGALAVVPRAMVATHGVVVRDRAAGARHGLGRRRLYRVPLLELGSAPRRREHGEVRRRAVGVDVRQPAGDAARAALVGHRRLGCLACARDEGGQPLPGDRRLEGVAEDAARDQRVAQVWRLQERVAPGAGAAGALLPRRVAAVCPADLERALDPGVERMVGRLEAEHEQRLAGRRRSGEARLARVEQAAVRRPQAGLHDLARRPGAGLERVEQHARARAELRTPLHPHPGLRHDPERPLGAEEEAVWTRP